MREGGFRFGPIVRAGLLLGIGLGGFVDGIVLHQILQWHNMMSARIPPNDLVAVKTNMVWDGYFHAGVWIVTALGVIALFRAGARRDAAWSGPALFGGWLAGWGLFNLVEGVIDHQILGLHHVVENAPDRLTYDLAFLASGVLFLGLGTLIVRRARRREF